MSVSRIEVRSDVGRWCQLPEWLLDSKVSDAAIRLFGILGAKYADRVTASTEKNKGLTRQQLADDMKRSTASVDRAKKELIEVGALAIEPQILGGTRLADIYLLAFTNPRGNPSSDLQRGVVTDDEGVSANLQRGGCTDDDSLRSPESVNESPNGDSRPDTSEGSPFDVEAARLCAILAELVVANGTPAKKIKPTSKAWRDEARRLLDIDGRDPREVEQLIRWCQQPDCWWRPNILSMPKFRERYDTLRLQALRDGALRSFENVSALPAQDVVIRTPDPALGQLIRNAIGDDVVDIWISKCWHGQRGDVYVLGCESAREHSWLTTRYARVLSKVAKEAGYAGLDLLEAQPPATKEEAA